MQKILLLLVVSFFVGKNCEAQNLVPNPSFEDTVACPFDVGLVSYSTGWSSYSFSPDFFIPCGASLDIQVPKNFAGYQFPSTGNCYFGYGSSYQPWDLHREIFGRALATPLVVGTKYFVTARVSLANHSYYASDEFGIAFSTVAFDGNFTFPPILNQSKVFADSVISDTANWSIVSGSFISDSSYQYIMVGNFFEDSLVTKIPNDTGFSVGLYWTYYYIDDVCVSPDSLACDLNPEGIYNLKETKASINLYPNPVSEQLTVESVGSQQIALGRIEIVDALERVLFTVAKPLPTSNIQLQTFPSGIYFIKVYFGDGSMEVRRFVKE